jgi:putative nucleic acid binding protein
MTQYPPHYYAQPPPPAPVKGLSGLGIAALVLGIIALPFSWVPFCGLAAVPVAGVGLILAVVGFIVSKTGGRSGVGMPVAGGVVCLLGILAPIVTTGGSLYVFHGSVKEAEQQADVRRAGQAEDWAAWAATQPATAPAVVDAAYLHQSYRDDESAAHARYKDRDVEITGTVAETSTAPSGQRYVILAPAPARPGGVQCFFSRDNAAPFSALRTGQTVRIRGRCEGMSRWNVVVRGCVVMQ